MPIHEIRRISNHNTLGLWKIAENPEELINNLRLSHSEVIQYNSFSNDTRRKHWLSYRRLIQEMQHQKNPELYYDENGKLCTKDGSFQLSVSHSGDFSAVLINNTGPAGIDVEKISERIIKIAPRFLSDIEWKNSPEKDHLAYLCTCWAIKEAIYKFHGRKGIDFKEHIRIEPFDFKKETTTKVRILDSDSISVQFEIIENYALAFTL